MKTPKRLQPLLDDGFIDDVLRPLMSGKEAAVYVVRAQGQLRCAKVYKEASKRSFHNQAEYQEGRKVRNSRQARAMQKRSRFGRREQEEAWQNAEVDALYRLAGAGVRVPKPHGFVDGVLLMDLIAGADGDVAPRLNDVELTAAEARDYHQVMMREVVRMLSVGLIHGDLSEYNVLLGPEGPIIIDLPQAVDAAANNSAERMLTRDVDNMARYFGRFAPELLTIDYAGEIWSLFQLGNLSPDIPLTGTFKRSEKSADLEGVMREIDAARDEHLGRSDDEEADTEEEWRDR
ncbi:RIO kinase 1 [Modicisalibacter ilicicola DSM 19980]|uniref:non-specific serine/threonine protein kinase n=1 Tax=Modicisalibacter ilicicola DSM 19980 TaxID=1121942 RepID=A0A1M4SEG6_9GAMM|nr:PA4780 family RIO1-like protein kinase [Halomonas ilicicola]SHE30644.1 RIO kinase 1 [Halomonas ilicicola DSM 19980]